MRHQLRLFIFSAPFDFAIATGAYLFTFSVRLFGLRSVNFEISFILVSALILTLSLWFFGVYRRLWGTTSGRSAVIIVQAVAAATAIIFLLSLFSTPRPIPLSVVVTGSSLALAGFVAIRFRSRFIDLETIRRRTEPATNATNVLIVGAGKLGQNIAFQLKQRSPKVSYKIVGFIDDDASKHGLFVEDCRVLGDRASIPQVAQQFDVELIALALPTMPGKEFRDILGYCEKTTARIKVVPDVQTMMSPNTSDSLLRDVGVDDLIGRSAVTRSANVDFTPIIGKSVLVTGAAGSIGSELSRQLATYQPKHLILLDCNESDLHDLHVHLRMKDPELRVTPALVDILQSDLVEAIFERFQPQVVFHCAAYKHVPMLEHHPQQAIRTNITGTRHVAELAQRYHAERFVLISTDKAIHPSSVMGASKRVCELLIHHIAQRQPHGTRFTAVRFGNVLGSRGSVVPMFARQIDQGGPVTVTDPNMTRFFMTIPEAVNLVIHAACLTQGGDLFVLNMGEVVRIVTLAERMIRLRGLRPNIDIPIHFTGVRPGEKMHEALFMEDEEAIPTAHPQILQVKEHEQAVIMDFSTQIERLEEATDPLVIRGLLHELVALERQPA